MMYDLAIIGGGPAGVAAGVYAARKRLKTVFITKNFDGQSSVSEKIENWIGTKSISGAELAKSLKEHLFHHAGESLEIKEGEYVKTITRARGHFTITTDTGAYETRTILITTGSSRRKLDIPGAAQFDNKGVTYCASCDGPLFANMDVAVIGGGNAAFETASQLLAYCKSVTLLHRSDRFRADEVTVNKVLSHPSMKVHKNVDLVEIKGDSFVQSIVYIDKATNEKKTLPVQGIFVEIGSLPNTDYVKDLVKRDDWNHIVVNPRNQRSSRAGIWAAGDCTDGLFHQNNIAAGDAVKALEDIYLYIHTSSR